MKGAYTKRLTEYAFVITLAVMVTIGIILLNLLGS